VPHNNPAEILVEDMSAPYKYLKDMLSVVNEHISQLETKSNGKILTKPFEDIFNKITLALAITDLFLKAPEAFNSTIPVTKEQILTQALKTVYRDLLFVATMSSIEYHFSRILLRYPHYKTAQKIQEQGVRKVKYSSVVEWACEEEILADKDLWDFAISARNDIAHHNAIARETKSSPINDFPIEMKEGSELAGKLRSLLSLTKHIEESFFNMVLGLQ
jgi:hypothetical protein